MPYTRFQALTYFFKGWWLAYNEHFFLVKNFLIKNFLQENIFFFFERQENIFFFLLILQHILDVWFRPLTYFSDLTNFLDYSRCWSTNNATFLSSHTYLGMLIERVGRKQDPVWLDSKTRKPYSTRLDSKTR